MTTLASLTGASGLELLTRAYSANTGLTTTNVTTGGSSLLSSDKALSSLTSKEASQVASSEFSFVGAASSVGASMTLIGASADMGGAGLTGGDLYENFIQQKASVYLDDNELSSQQISSALYSGQGVQTVSGPGTTTDATIADEVNSLNQSAASANQFAANLTAWEAAGRPTGEYSSGFLAGYSDDQLNVFIAEQQSNAATDAADASGIAAAFANHTLTIQKATDVQGLNYTESVWDSTDGNGESGGVNQSYSQAFLNADADGKNHLLESASTGGNVMLYLTWQ